MAQEKFDETRAQELGNQTCENPDWQGREMPSPVGCNGGFWEMKNVDQKRGKKGYLKEKAEARREGPQRESRI